MRVATLAKRLPQLAKKTSLLMGLRKRLSHRKVVMIKEAPKTDKTEDILSASSTAEAFDGDNVLMFHVSSILHGDVIRDASTGSSVHSLWFESM
jgi:hypothetical protein